MPSNFALDSGFLDDKYPSRGLSRRFDGRPFGRELKVTSEPTIDPALLAEIKNEIRNRHTQDDNMLRGYIKQATSDVENFVGRAIVTQTLQVYWKRVYGYVYLPRPPLSSITSVTEIDDDGTETSLTSSDYDTIGNEEVLIDFDSWVNKQLKIVYVAGYGDKSDDLPRWAKSAVRWQTRLYYQKEPELAVDAVSGLVLPALSACENYIYQPPE